MSKIKEIISMIYECFDDGEKHEYIDIQSEAIKRNIIPEDNNSAVNNAIFRLKKIDGRFKSVDKGIYQFDSKEQGIETFSLEELLDKLDEKIKKIQKIDVIMSSEEEVQKALDDRKRLKEYAVKLNALFDKSDNGHEG